MATQYKENKVYLYLISPKIPETDRRTVDDYKVTYKNAFLFNKDRVVKVEQGDGSVSAIKAKKYRNSNLIGGAFIYNLEHNLPPRYNPSTNEAAELDLDGFKGLGYDSAYVYDPDLMVLAMEKRVPGTTLESLRNLIFLNNELPGFEFIPICYKDSYQKFLRSEGVKSMSMKILSVPEKPKKREAESSLKEAKDMLDEVNGEHITISIGSGKRRDKFLNKTKIVEMAQNALNSFGFAHEATTFELKIVDIDSGKVEPIDLISGAITHKTKIQKVRAINRFSISEKNDQIYSFLYDKSESIYDFCNDYLDGI